MNGRAPRSLVMRRMILLLGAAILLCATILLACCTHQPPRQACGQPELLSAAGACTCDGKSTEDCISVVEFNDSGQLADGGQLPAAVRRVHAAKDAVVLVFIHGWTHEAAACDEHYSEFRRMVPHLKRELEGRRPVVGIYIGWRGKQLKDPLDSLTFWTRMRAARLLGDGGLSCALADIHGAATGPVVVVGHSLGGKALFGALEMSAGMEGRVGPDEPLAEIAILINPAQDSHDFRELRDAAASPKLPRVLVLAATNDTAVRGWFRVARLIYRAKFAFYNWKEWHAESTGIGHLDADITHELRCRDPQPSPCYVVMESVPNPGNENFIVAKAPPEVIDGHGAIFTDHLREFLVRQTVCLIEKKAPCPD
jgi:pimeloyl-ACP methyl ester carboxylesterase